MTDQTETARALLWRHGLPEDVIDGALCLHAQELAAAIREETRQLKAHGVLEPDKYRPCRDAANQIDPTRNEDDVDPEDAAPAVQAPAADRAAPAVWIDGHPQMEAIAAAVWERCGRSDSGMCVEDDPRNIAVAALAAVLPAPTDRASEWRAAADAVEAMNEGCGQTKPCASCDARTDAADALRNATRRMAAVPAAGARQPGEAR